MPDCSGKKSKVKRLSAPIGSWPIMAKNMPSSSMTRLLITIEVPEKEITSMLSTMTAASSGGPNFMATSAIGPIRTTVAKLAAKSPMAEAASAMSSALRDMPFLVSGRPS